MFSIITRFLSFFYRIFLSRVLTSATLGIYTIAVSVFGIFNTILASGTPLTISKLVSINVKNEKENSKIVTAGFVINSIISISLVIFVILFKDFFNLFFTDSTSYIILLTMIPAILSTGFYTAFRGYLYGKEKYLHIGFVELIEQILRMIICFILIYLLFPSSSPYPVGISFGIAGVLSTILGIVVYFKCGGKVANPKGYFAKIIKTSTPITLVRLGGSLIIPLISILIPLRLVSAGYSNNLALSQIGIIMGMTMPLLTIPSTIIGSFSTALIPRVALLFKSKDYNSMNNEILSSLNFSLILTFLVIPCFVALGKPVCEFLFNNIEAGVYLIRSAWLMVPMCYTLLSTSILNAIGLERKSFWVYLFASVFLILSIIFLPKYIGANAIIVGIGISSSISSVLNMILISKSSELSNSHIKTVLYLSIISIFVSLFAKYLYNILFSFLPLFFAMSFTCIIYVTLFILLLMAFNILNIYSFWQTIRVKLKVKSLIKNKKSL